jgi:hypothetical protein
MKKKCLSGWSGQGAAAATGHTEIHQSTRGKGNITNKTHQFFFIYICLAKICYGIQKNSQKFMWFG